VAANHLASAAKMASNPNCCFDIYTSLSASLAQGITAMPIGRDEILDAALKLSESDRLVIATRLLDTLPDDLPGPPEDDPAFLEELDRRAKDTEGWIPASELWKSP
jgi:hypothetical protein